MECVLCGSPRVIETDESVISIFDGAEVETTGFSWCPDCNEKFYEFRKLMQLCELLESCAGSLQVLRFRFNEELDEWIVV